MEENKTKEVIGLLQGIEEGQRGFIAVESITRNGELFIKGDNAGLRKLALKLLKAAETKANDGLFDDEVEMAGEAESIIIVYDGTDRVTTYVDPNIWGTGVAKIGCVVILGLIILVFAAGLYHIARLLI